MATMPAYSNNPCHTSNAAASTTSMSMRFIRLIMSVPGGARSRVSHTYRMPFSTIASSSTNNSRPYIRRASKLS